MTNGFFVEYIETTDIFKQIRELFKNFCGLEIEVRKSCKISYNREALDNFDEIASQPNSAPLSSRSSLLTNCESVICKRTVDKNLQFVTESKKNHVFTCPCGFKKILVPIILKDTAIGVLLSSENQQHRFNLHQMNAVNSLLKNITDYVVRNEFRSFSEFKGNKLTHQQKLLNKVIQYVWDNYDQSDMTLMGVSKEVGISYHYLSRLFKRELKTTFAQFRSKIRLDVASKLLTDQSLTVSQVSYSCGFDDPSYFCKVFKDSFGKSPVDFRKKPGTFKLTKGKRFFSR